MTKSDKEIKTMDWEALGESTLTEVTHSLVTDGFGTAGGFLAAGFVGRQLQTLTGQTDDKVTGLMTLESLYAWLANNGPKMAVWYLTKGYAATSEVVADARKAMMGSVVFDTILRLTNNGINPASVVIPGIGQVLGSGTGGVASSPQDVNRLIQENTALRTELNKALQRLASQPGVQPGMIGQAEGPIVQPLPTPPHVQERQKRYGAMQPTNVQERQKKYGSMAPPREVRYGFVRGSEENIAAMHGML